MSWYYLDQLLDLSNPASINGYKVSNTAGTKKLDAAKDYLNLTTYFGENPYEHRASLRPLQALGGRHSNVGNSWHMDYLTSKPAANQPFSGEWAEWKKTLSETGVDHQTRPIVVGRQGDIDFVVPSLVEDGSSLTAPESVTYNVVDYDSISGVAPIDISAQLGTAIEFVSHLDGVHTGIVYAEVRVKDRAACIAAGFNPASDSYFRPILVVPKQDGSKEVPVTVNTRGKIAIEIPPSWYNHGDGEYVMGGSRIHPYMALLPKMITLIYKWQECLPDPRGGTYLRNRSVIVPPSDYTMKWDGGAPNYIGYTIYDAPLYSSIVVKFDNPTIYDPAKDPQHKLYYVVGYPCLPLTYGATMPSAAEWSKYMWVYGRTVSAMMFVYDTSKLTFEWADGKTDWPEYYPGMVRKLKITEPTSGIVSYVDIPIRPASGDQPPVPTEDIRAGMNSIPVSSSVYASTNEEIAKKLLESLKVSDSDRNPVEHTIVVEDVDKR